MSFHLPISPLQIIPAHPGSGQGIRLFIKRDDLLHPEIQGSKGRKLAAILPQVKATHPAGVVTFGGAFSNHLHAVAIAGRILGIPTHGVLRGAHADLQNPTLMECQENGMKLYPVPKVLYDSIKVQGDEFLEREFAGCYVLPEGGNTPQAVAACATIASEILAQLPPDRLGCPLFLCTPAGTGCTAAGIVSGLNTPEHQALIFPVVSHGFERQTIARLLPDVQSRGQEFHIHPEYSFGGFAKLHPPVIAFVRQFFEETNILLDPVYTAKMLFGVFDLLTKNHFPIHSTVVVLHTGGLQGWSGFESRFGSSGIART